MSNIPARGVIAVGAVDAVKRALLDRYSDAVNIQFEPNGARWIPVEASISMLAAARVPNS